LIGNNTIVLITPRYKYRDKYFKALMPLVVADFVSLMRLGRIFGLFYTFVIAGGALAPMVFGKVSDRFDIRFTVMVIAVTALFTLPLALFLRRSVKRTAGR
jgi:MFS family permease